jgi:hypothetical protein
MSDFEDCTLTPEYRIGNHYVARVRSLRAPPRAYRAAAQEFDMIARRLDLKIEFGERDADQKRAEWLTLTLSHGVVRVYLASDCLEYEIKISEYDGTESSSRDSA